MTHQYLFKFLPLALAAALTACGGNDGDGGNSPEPLPPAVQMPFKLEHLIGSTEADLQVCPYGSWRNSNEKRFSYLIRARIFNDELYLLDSGEACKAVRSGGRVYPVEYRADQIKPSHDPGTFMFQVSGSDVIRSINIDPDAHFIIGSSPPVIRFSNSLFFPGDRRRPLMLGHVAANSELNYELDPAALAHHAAVRNGWER